MRRLLAMLVVLIAVVSLTGSAGSPAVASPTFTITPGGAFTGTSSGAATFTDTNTGATITCASSTSSGTLATGTVVTVLGTISTMAFSGCTGPLGLTATVVPDPSCAPVTLNGLNYDGPTGTTTLTVGFCFKITIGGSVIMIKGTITATYVNATHQISFSVGNLSITAVSGTALGLFHPGDLVKTIIKYILAPAQLITSP